jgi:hypothetical protein
MTINNPNPYPLHVADVFVVWNNDKGHQTGGDKTLTLLSASLGGTVFWNGSVASPSTTISPTVPGSGWIPAGASTSIVFNFHQTYDNPDPGFTEEILIHFSTNGCQGVVIHQRINEP